MGLPGPIWNPWFEDVEDRPNRAAVFSLGGGAAIVGLGFLILDLGPGNVFSSWTGLSTGQGGTAGIIVGIAICAMALLMLIRPRFHLEAGTMILGLVVVNVFFEGPLAVIGLVAGAGGVLALLFVPPRPMPPELTARVPRPLASNVRACSYCEAPLPQGAAVCANCGRPVGEARAVTTSPAKP